MIDAEIITDIGTERLFLLLKLVMFLFKVNEIIEFLLDDLSHLFIFLIELNDSGYRWIVFKMKYSLLLSINLFLQKFDLLVLLFNSSFGKVIQMWIQCTGGSYMIIVALDFIVHLLNCCLKHQFFLLKLFDASFIVHFPLIKLQLRFLKLSLFSVLRFLIFIFIASFREGFTGISFHKRLWR